MSRQPFVYITGFFSFGIILNILGQNFLGLFCCVIVAFLIVSIMFRRKAALSTVFLLLSIAVLGIVYTQSRQTVGKDHIVHVAKYYRQRPVEVKGVVASSVDQRKAVNGLKTTFTLEVDHVKAPWGWQKRDGKILVNVFRSLNLDYGDRIQLEGKLHRPYNFSTDNNFSYRDYLYHREIYYILSVKKNAQVLTLAKGQGNVLRSRSLALRQKLKGILIDHLSVNEAGIMSAILLGDRTTIPKPIRQLFVQTGTAHILAISGLHIGIVAAMLLTFIKFFPFNRPIQLSWVAILLIGYAFLTGGRPSVVRATIMMVVFLGSLIIEKESYAFNTMCLAALFILILNPANLFDVGFQLSFACVFSIIYLNMRLKKNELFSFLNNRAHRTVYYVSQSVILSLAIWIGVSGLIAYYFNIITPVTILANVLIVPLISIIIALGFGLLIIGIAFPSGAFLFAVCLKAALNVMVGIIFLFSKLPLAYIYIEGVKIWHLLVYYTLIASIALGFWKYLACKFAVFSAQRRRPFSLFGRD